MHAGYFQWGFCVAPLRIMPVYHAAAAAAAAHLAPLEGVVVGKQALPTCGPVGAPQLHINVGVCACPLHVARLHLHAGKWQ